MPTTLRKLDIGVIVAVGTSVIGAAFWLGGLSSDVAALKPERLEELRTETQQRIDEEIARMQGGIGPVSSEAVIGQIIFWHQFEGQELPEGYAVCDGEKIVDPQSTLLGERTPNLIDRFVMGVGLNRLGEMGGDSTSELTSRVTVTRPGGSGWVRLTGGDINVPHNFNLTANAVVFSNNTERVHDNRPDYLGLIPLIRVR